MPRKTCRTSSKMITRYASPQETERVGEKWMNTRITGKQNASQLGFVTRKTAEVSPNPRRRSAPGEKKTTGEISSGWRPLVGKDNGSDGNSGSQPVFKGFFDPPPIWWGLLTRL